MEVARAGWGGDSETSKASTRAITMWVSITHALSVVHFLSQLPLVDIFLPAAGSVTTTISYRKNVKRLCTKIKKRIISQFSGKPSSGNMKVPWTQRTLFFICFPYV
jgi:hypothetical protein